MSRMRHTSAQDHESNLDALLEDLQTTVSRSNSQLNLNGTMTTGYREIRRTVTDGTPHGTMNEYQIEYLNPANSTHHITESNNSYNGSQQHHREHYKESYNYSGSEHTSGGRSDVKLKQNISELDSLLDDLNTAQKKSFSENTTIMRHNTHGIDPGLLEPVISSTPQGHLHEEKHFQEERVVRGRSSSPRRELVFTGTTRSRDPSPIQPVRQQQFYRYEKTTSTRTTGPVMTDITSQVDSNQYQRGNNLAIEDSSLRGRSPSPRGNRIEYHYTKTTTDNREGVPHFPVDKSSKYKEHDMREYSPQSYTGGKTSNSYMYSSSNSSNRETRSEVPRSPPPHRSPSPVSFQQPPPPNNKLQGPYSYEPPPQSPQPIHKFAPVEPNHNSRLTYNVSQPHTTVSSYKYSSTTTTNNYNSQSHEEAPLLPRPFPSPSPTPEQQEQHPPKKLDELMASFSETELRNRRNETVHRYDREREHRETENLNQHLLPNGKEKEKIVDKEKQVVKKEESKNIQGPPVYYPPGELFTKKEESMMQQQSGGGGAMYKSKAKYEYEAMSKSKSKESGGKAVVPVCLPLCCAMPCTIM